MGKRVHEDDAAESPAKHAKREENATGQSDQRIAELEHELAFIKEIAKFASEGVKDHTAVGCALKLIVQGVSASDDPDFSIETKRTEIFYDLYQKQADDEYESVCYGNADEVVQAMAAYVPYVKDLARRPGGLKYAFRLVEQLGTSVHGDLDRKDGSGYGDSEEQYEKLDKAMKAVLYELLKPPGIENDHDWLLESLKKLTQERDLIAGYGLKGYFPASIEILANAALILGLLDEKKEDEKRLIEEAKQLGGQLKIDGTVDEAVDLGAETRNVRS